MKKWTNVEFPAIYSILSIFHYCSNLPRYIYITPKCEQMMFSMISIAYKKPLATFYVVEYSILNISEMIYKDINSKIYHVHGLVS